MIKQLKTYLTGLSFRTGAIVLFFCIPFYILSFAQALLPISAVWKGVLWFILFGTAKICQYTGIAILGIEGVKRIKRRFAKK